MRVHHLNNVSTAFRLLEKHNVSRMTGIFFSCLFTGLEYSMYSALQQVKLVNISSNDIVDGNPKLTLGLVWSIILHWQVSRNVPGSRPRSLLLMAFVVNTPGARRIEGKHGGIAAVQSRQDALELVSRSHQGTVKKIASRDEIVATFN